MAEDDAQREGGDGGGGGRNGGVLKEILSDLRERRSPWLKTPEEEPVGEPADWGGPRIRADHYRRLQDRYSRNY